MRQAGTIASERDAERLADYLLVLGISCRVSPEGDAWAIWIHDEEKIEQAKRELAEFVENPDAERFAKGAGAAKSFRKQQQQVEARAQKVQRKTMRAARPSLARSMPLTMTLIVASVVVFMMSDFGRQYKGVRAKLHIGGFSIVDEDLRQLREGQVWRLVTPVFIHFTFIHILFNMMWMYQLGRTIESVQSSWFLALLVLVLAVSSNLAQYYFQVGGLFDQKPISFSPSPAFGGMSGVVFGLFGYIWVKARYDPFSGYVMDQQTVMYMILFFAFCMLGLLPIANTAHGVGLAGGAAIGYASARISRHRRWR